MSLRKGLFSPFVGRALAGLLSLAVLSSCSAPVSEDGAAASPLAAAAEPAAGTQRHMRLMSPGQYLNTMVYVFGPDVVTELPDFAPFQRTDGLLATGAAYDGITGVQAEQYVRASRLIAARVVSDERRAFLLPCQPRTETAADAACATKYLARVGRLLFRRPLTEAELDEVVAQAREGAERTHDFYKGIAVALEGLMVNPKTLFITTLTEPDAVPAGRQRLTAYSLASRLSFFLWNTAPDEVLLDAAARGDLHSQKGLAKVVDAMLASPRLETGIRAFFDDMLRFEAFANLAKDPQTYPAFTGQAADDAREQTLRLVVDHLLKRNGDYRDLFTSRDTFIAPSLAPIYQSRSTRGWTLFTAPADEPRAGLLTQISFLALHSHPARTSPTLRGKAVRELLMCQTVPQPPGNVDFSALENPKSQYRTQRDRVTFHLANPVCAGCHRITDPIGLALENFDGAGQYRTTERGAEIDASGSLEGKDFKDVAGLGKILHDSPAVTDCLVKRVFAYATGGRLRREDQAIVGYFNQHFAAGGYRMPGLLRAIALSKSFSEIDNVKDASAQAAAVLHTPKS